MKELKYRMYSFVMYNLSDIQKGIQPYHASMRYARQYFNDADFQRWVWYDETVILLSGGGSNDLIDHCENLKTMSVKLSTFIEPDLNMATSSVSFLVDERIWDKEQYPEPERNELLKDGEKALHHLTYAEVEIRKVEYFTKLFGDENMAKLRLYLNKQKLA